MFRFGCFSIGVGRGAACLAPTLVCCWAVRSFSGFVRRLLWGASAVVWGDWLLRRKAFSRDCGFRRGVVLFPVCAVCRGLGRWYVAGLVRVCACVVGSRVLGGQVVCAHELYESPRGNKVDGLPRAASRKQRAQ